MAKIICDYCKYGTPDKLCYRGGMRRCEGELFEYKPASPDDSSSRSESTLPPLHEMAAENFDNIAEIASRITSGNASHQGRTIEGMARRNAEFIRKYYV